MAHEWHCPRCGRGVFAYTEGAFKSMCDVHIAQHIRDDEKERQKAQAMTTAIQVFIPKDYDRLILTPTDIGFLRTRGIKIDDQIELDLISKHSPSKTELDQVRWARILHNAWELIPPKEIKDGDPGTE